MCPIVLGILAQLVQCRKLYRVPEICIQLSRTKSLVRLKNKCCEGYLLRRQLVASKCADKNDEFASGILRHSKYSAQRKVEEYQMSIGPPERVGRHRRTLCLAPDMDLALKLRDFKKSSSRKHRPRNRRPRNRRQGKMRHGTRHRRRLYRQN
jgi:hypothetical protein